MKASINGNFIAIIPWRTGHDCSKSDYYYNAWKYYREYNCTL